MKKTCLLLFLFSLTAKVGENKYYCKVAVEVPKIQEEPERKTFR